MSSDRSMSLEQNKRIFKIIVIGDSSVGKTCLTYRFCGGKFPMKTEATIGVDFRERAVEVDNETIKLTFWDTAGTERFRRGLPPNFYRRVHVAVFVYDVTNNESFKSLDSWIEEWMMNRTTDIQTKLFLIGNKNDAESERCVSAAKARNYARSNNMLFFETSAAKSEMSDLDEILLSMAKYAKMADPVEKKSIIVRNTVEPPTKSNYQCC